MDFEVGQLVRIGEHGVSEFKVVGEAEDGRVLIEPTLETAINRHPIPYRPEWLFPIDDTD
jgi:hypothetical protein